MSERMVRPGEKYRHFKDKLYQIVAVASHSETGEKMVVYQALYGDFQVYVRPYDLFVSLVDKEKYPQVSQQYRFEKVEELPQTEGKPQAASQPQGQSQHQAQPQESPVTEAPHPDFLRFLDTDDYDTRMECLKRLESVITQTELNSIYLVLDMKEEEGDVKSRIEAIRRVLTMQDHFDGNRLR